MEALGRGPQTSFYATRGLLELLHWYGGPGQRGVLGLVGDLGWFESEAMARALSKKRSYALLTIVVQSEEVRAGLGLLMMMLLPLLSLPPSEREHHRLLVAHPAAAWLPVWLHACR